MIFVFFADAIWSRDTNEQNGLYLSAGLQPVFTFDVDWKPGPRAVSGDILVSFRHQLMNKTGFMWEGIHMEYGTRLRFSPRVKYMGLRFEIQPVRIFKLEIESGYLWINDLDIDYLGFPVSSSFSMVTPTVSFQDTNAGFLLVSPKLGLDLKNIGFWYSFEVPLIRYGMFDSLVTPFTEKNLHHRFSIEWNPFFYWQINLSLVLIPSPQPETQTFTTRLFTRIFWTRPLNDRIEPRIDLEFGSLEQGSENFTAISLRFGLKYKIW